VCDLPVAPCAPETRTASILVTVQEIAQTFGWLVGTVNRLRPESAGGDLHFYVYVGDMGEARGIHAHIHTPRRLVLGIS
jgi:hypothetical protein